MSWGSVSGVASYTLQKKNSGRWSTVYSGSGKSKAFSGKADASYGYHAQACNTEGCGPWSATKTASVSLPPPVPTGAAAQRLLPYHKGRFDVSWDAVSGATCDEVQETSDQNPGQDQEVELGALRR